MYDIVVVRLQFEKVGFRKARNDNLFFTKVSKEFLIGSLFNHGKKINWGDMSFYDKKYTNTWPSCSVKK
jgi:hypothetical protein